MAGFTLVAFEFGDSAKLGCSQKISKRWSIKVFSIKEELNSLDLDFRFYNQSIFESIEKYIFELFILDFSKFKNNFF